MTPAIRLGNPQDQGPYLVTVEHASNRVPPPLSISAADAPWMQTHWGWDIGAAIVAEELVAQTRSAGICCGFSRLVCDVNRPPADPTWIRTEIEGHPLSFNSQLTAAERTRRERLLYDAYHAAVDNIIRERSQLPRPVFLLAMHSFTPVFQGKRRVMEVGVLFDEHDDLARDLCSALEAAGFVTALNEPYSGAQGFMFSIDKHGRGHALPNLELEIRQDLIETPETARSIAQRINAALQKAFG